MPEDSCTRNKMELQTSKLVSECSARIRSCSPTEICLSKSLSSGRCVAEEGTSTGGKTRAHNQNAPYPLGRARKRRLTRNAAWSRFGEIDPHLELNSSRLSRETLPGCRVETVAIDSSSTVQFLRKKKKWW